MWAMEIVIPRAFSSGALSIESNGVYSANPRSANVFEIAAVNVVLPWSMWPIVPMFTCGLLRSNFFLAISALSPLLPPRLLADPGLGAERLGVVRSLRPIVAPALGHRPQVRGVAEHLGEGPRRGNDRCRAPVLGAFELA